MDNYLYIEEVLSRLPLPIALCDGESPLQMEESFMYFLKMKEVPFVLESHLYSRDDYNLSQYKTIAFSTLDSGPYLNPKTEKIFSFDKNNLKMIIVLNKNAFDKIKGMSKKLNLECVAFLPGDFQFTDPFKIPEGMYW